jgi:hypothetical protein
MKFKFLILALSGLSLAASPAEAKPLSYPGGWQTRADFSGDGASLLNTYTLSPLYGIGLHNEYNREDDYQMHSLHLANRLWRGNYPDAQANLYLESGLGYARSDGGDEESAAAYTGILADWENRRFYTEYSNRYVHAGDVTEKFSHSARIGVAPYIAESGDLHSWLILQLDHTPKGDNHFTVTPLVRLFQASTMVEAGIRNDGKILFHVMHQF